MTKFKMMTASILAVATIASTTPASADVYTEEYSTQVSYKGLDLNSASGQEKLQKRIRYAVRNVCGYHQARTQDQIAHAKTCMKTAQSKADGQVQVAIANYKQNRQLAARDIMVGN